MSEQFWLEVTWGSRADTLDESAAMVTRLLEGLSAARPQFATWYDADLSREVALKQGALSAETAAIRTVLKRNYSKARRLEPAMRDGTFAGYHFNLWDGGPRTGCRALYLRCGQHNPDRDPSLPNTCVLHLGNSDPEPTAEEAAALLSTMVASLRPRWGRISTLSMIPTEQLDKTVRKAGWITYAQNGSAGLLASVPEGCIQPIGESGELGCLLFATRDLFSSMNPDHVSAVVRIAHNLSLDTLLG